MQEENIPPFDYKIIKQVMDELLVATRNLLEREWPQQYERERDGQIVLMQYVGLAFSHFRTITFICADVNDGAVRSPLFALSVPPLNRAILEIIFSVLYLLDDLPAHTQLYYRAAWRAEQEFLNQYQSRYGGKGRLRSDAYIANRTEKQAVMEHALQITAEEKNDLNKILRWPKMRQLRSRLKNSPDTLSYLEYLDDWFYGVLSTQSHVEPMGLGEMGLHFLGMQELMIISGEDRDGAERRLDEKIVEFRTTQLWMAMTLILSLISEISIHFGYDLLKKKLLFVWTIIYRYSEISQEVYDERYRGSLSS